MKKYCIFAVCALLSILAPTSVIILIPSAECLKPFIPTITACITLLLGWFFTTYNNNENFFKSETIKHKDKLVAMIEDFFEDFLEKLKSRTVSDEDRESFVSDKITNLEFKHSIQQKIYGKKAVIFLSDESFVKLRMVWQLENIEYKKQKRKVQELKDEILQEVENNYIKWLKGI
ncbi:hypothetical protein NYR77_01280 [Actinobacillus equuli subsp. haemolyticus]|uniref:hypothetical protein n=1 Tax=Actinobacillus equuli TaxID=718 RepID=UPI00244203D3|nr:hypothetical protein [Actinobacillus equuli]WGE67688.1 hypothetical protein NYR77_01280 [Actinobacillus equuli subsp. haemolyticus]